MCFIYYFGVKIYYFYYYLYIDLLKNVKFIDTGLYNKISDEPNLTFCF